MNFHLASTKNYPWWLRMVKNLPAMQETRVWSLGQEDPLEKEMAPHSSTLAWRIPWTEEPGGLQSMGSQSQTPLSDWTTTYTLKIYLFIQLCWALAVACGIWFPDQGLNLGPLHWECSVLTTGPPEKSSTVYSHAWKSLADHTIFCDNNRFQIFKNFLCS